jgi:hypothetical protein
MGKGRSGEILPPPTNFFKGIFMSIWDLILLVITTEAITEIISKAEIFYPFRKWLFTKSRWLHGLVDCPYCTSVWIAMFLISVGYVSQVLSFYGVFKFFLYGFAIHRFANILHFVIDRIDPYHIELEKGSNDIMEKEE